MTDGAGGGGASGQGATGGPATAMVLAAGRGRRLRPLTDALPKPLIEVAGRPLIDHVLDRLVAAGVERAVVNTHHLAEQVEAHLATRERPQIRISREAELLGTGRGVAQVLPWLGPGPFYIADADVFWLDGPVPALDRLAGFWDAERMDALLLLMSTPKAFGVDGTGDFYLDPHGRILRNGPSRVAPFYYAGAEIVHPRLYDGMPAGAFNAAAVWDRALEAGRLWGLVHDGGWFHVGTPEGLEEVTAQLAGGSVRWVEP